MNDYREIEERLSAGQENYRRIPVPEEMKAKLEAGIARAEEERSKGGSAKGWERIRRKRRRIAFRTATAAAAAAALLVILPNTGAKMAYAMGDLPVVGRLFQAVTFRDYQYEGEGFEADVEVPQIVVGAGEQENAAKETTRTQNNAAQEQSAEKNSGALQEAVEQINFDIGEVTDRLIREFQASADLGEGHGSLEIHHETVTDNDRYFTLKLSIYQAAASGYESYQFYTIDKKTGKQIQIGDLFREDSRYNEVLSGNIKEQMRAKMAEDENNIYWVDQTDMPESNFEKLKDDQNFYFDGAGNIVIVFDEYEVAPGYMGAQEFTVEKSVFEGMLK